MAVANTKKDTGKDLFQNLENFLATKSTMIFYGCLALTAIFGLLLFDGRLSFATDDATYILNALTFIKKGAYPNFQGALYPFFLAIIIKLFGVRILLLKTFSFVFLLLHNFVFYKAFKGRVPYLVLFSGLIMFSINAYILAYGSSTFSEAFYLFLQGLGFLTFFKLIDALAVAGATLKSTLVQWLLYGFVLFLMTITKNVALFAIIGVLGYFILRKEWKYVVMALVFFAVFKVPYEMVVRAKYGNIGKAQTDLLLRKDFNDPSKGNVDASDLMDRFYGNFGNYFTVHTFKILGLRESGVPVIWTFDKAGEIKYSQDPNTGERIQENHNPNFFYAVIFILLFGLGIIQAYKHNKFLFYMLMYVAVVSGVTFLALHTFWNQDRLILPYVPLILMGFCYGLYEFFNKRNISAGKIILPVFICLSLLIQLGLTLKTTAKNSKQFSGYLKGDVFAGYPEPVTNYLKVCDWAGKNLHDSMSILAAKTVEGAVFADGHSFSRMPEFRKDQLNPDSILAIFQKRKIGYILTDQFQGNMIQLAQALKQAKPQMIQVVYKEGEEGDAAELYKINF